MVGINSWVAHANKEVFGDDADHFRPERWLADKETVQRMDKYWLPVSYFEPEAPSRGEKSVLSGCESVLIRRLVWPWIQDLHWEEHQPDGDREAHSAHGGEVRLPSIGCEGGAGVKERLVRQAEQLHGSGHREEELKLREGIDCKQIWRTAV